jgi:hypothetical protein
MDAVSLFVGGMAGNLKSLQIRIAFHQDLLDQEL